jgi:carbon monoxide dehydrogenase subunit G
MEHESFIPIPAPRAAAALRTPTVVAASLPGWQPDSDAGTTGAAGAAGTSDAAGSGAPHSPGRGRLRLRVGGSTITYRGTVSVRGAGPAFTVRAEGTEVRGTGTVKVTAEVDVVATELPEPGTTLRWRGTAEADGRLAGFEAAVVAAAVRRLLDRFSAQLAEHAPEDVPEAAPEAAPADVQKAVPEGPSEELEPDVVDDLGEPPSGEPDDLELVEVEVEVPESAAALDDLVPPVEAAHARRTMIGRSAEEVDHAPPRGRYAPEPAPDSTSAVAALRWAAPAAAALVASAVVVGRVLRRRK